VGDVELPSRVDPFKYVVAIGAPSFNDAKRIFIPNFTHQLDVALSENLNSTCESFAHYHLQSFKWKSFDKANLIRNIYGQRELHRRGIGTAVTL
jgi:hypothetical protein